MPENILLLLTATKLLNFFCNHVIIFTFTCRKMCAKQKTHDVCAAEKHCHSNNIYV